jgi:hypothetical protein
MAIVTLEIPHRKPDTPAGSQEYKPHIFNEWKGARHGGSKFPSTSLYYENDHALPITGNALGGLFHSPNFHPEKHIRLLKMMFHDSNMDATIEAVQARVQKQLDNVNKSANDALRDLASFILAELLEDRGGGSYLQRKYPDFHQLDLELVITVPPGRSTIDHDRVLRAFAQRSIPLSAIFLESEPAAMFRSWVYSGESTKQWKVSNIRNQFRY